MNNTFNLINITFIWIGNPKYHLCPFFAEHFSKFRHAFLKKCKFLSFWVDIWSIFVNVRTYLQAPGWIPGRYLVQYLPVPIHRPYGGLRSNCVFAAKCEALTKLSSVCHHKKICVSHIYEMYTHMTYMYVHVQQDILINNHTYK